MIKQTKSEIKEEKEINQKDKALDETIKNIREQFGEGSIMKLGEATRVDVEAIPTGSISLDLATGVGGCREVELLKFLVRNPVVKLP